MERAMAEACTCLPCVTCRGHGDIPVMMGTRIVCGYDDLCDLEMCEECRGSGYENECDHCRDQREQDEAADEEFYRRGAGTTGRVKDRGSQ